MEAVFAVRADVEADAHPVLAVRTVDAVFRIVAIAPDHTQCWLSLPKKVLRGRETTPRAVVRGFRTLLRLLPYLLDMASEPAANGTNARQPTDPGFGFFFRA